MKKLLFFLLSVVLIGSVGCGSNKDLNTEVTDAGRTKVVNKTVEPTTEAVTVEKFPIYVSEDSIFPKDGSLYGRYVTKKK